MRLTVKLGSSQCRIASQSNGEIHFRKEECFFFFRKRDVARAGFFKIFFILITRCIIQLVFQLPAASEIMLCSFSLQRFCPGYASKQVGTTHANHCLISTMVQKDYWMHLRKCESSLIHTAFSFFKSRLDIKPRTRAICLSFSGHAKSLLSPKIRFHQNSQISNFLIFSWPWSQDGSWL